MELRQLQYFLAVVEEASFTRAAARVHVAQPGVSAQIRQLERELGQELLDRTGRTVRLTDAGAAVVPYARAALDAVAGARQAVDELTGLVRGKVTLGSVGSIASIDLPRLLADFRRLHPSVEISLWEANSADLVAALNAGGIDAAIVGLAAPALSGIRTQIVADEPIVAVVGPGGPFADRDAIRLTSLRDRPLITLPRGSGLRSYLDDACAGAGFTPRIAFEASDPRSLIQFARHGLGIAILPASIAGAHPGRLHTVAITRPRLRGRLALAWRSSGPASPAGRAFVAHARTALARAG
ncbi:MAG TPA: LysR substrate-binding domain-containing protein [Jatrophihabitantaceae bacterium]